MTTQNDIPQPQVIAMAGPNPAADANYRMNAANETQLQNNRALAGGKGEKGKGKGRKGRKKIKGGASVSPVKVPYHETAAGPDRMINQQQNVTSATMQANEYAKYDNAAFKGGSKRHYHKTKRNKSKSKRKLRNKSRKHKTRR